MREHVRDLVRAVVRWQLSLPFLFAAAVPAAVMAQAYPPDGPAIPAITLTGSPAVQQPAPNPPNQQSKWNMDLAGHSDLQGRSAYQPIIINQDGASDRVCRSPHGQQA